MGELSTLLWWSLLVGGLLTPGNRIRGFIPVVYTGQVAVGHAVHSCPGSIDVKELQILKS